MLLPPEDPVPVPRTGRGCQGKHLDIISLFPSIPLVSHTSGCLDIGLAALWICQDIILLFLVASTFLKCVTFLPCFCFWMRKPLKNFLCWLILFSTNLLVKNNLGFVYSSVWSEMFFGIAGISCIASFYRIFAMWSLRSKSSGAVFTLYLVTSFISLGFSEKGKIPWVPDFESKSLSSLPDKVKA